MRFLLYRDYESGLFNNWMCVELGIGLAALTGRELVYYGSVGERREVLHVRGGAWHRLRPAFAAVLDNRRLPTVFDLMEPLPTVMRAWPDYAALAPGLALHESAEKLTQAVFVHAAASAAEAQAIHGARLADFAAGRTVLTDPAEPVWHLHAANLGFASRFFFDPPPGLHALLGALRPRHDYAALAARVVAALGPFNGVHIRLTDFRDFLPQGEDYGATVAASLARWMPREDLLLVCSDEAGDSAFFGPLRAAFPRIRFLDEFIVGEFAGEFRALPFTDEQSLGFVCNLVMRHAREFAGTPGSTYSGFIHREWYRHRLADDPARPPPFRFIGSGERNGGGHEAGYFEDGVFVESRPGHYSWNRAPIRRSSDTLSWYREWPEAVQPP